MTKKTVLVGAALAAMITGCDASGRVGSITKTTADVRVINASSTSIDVLQGQSVSPGNGAIAFGAGSQCVTVEPVSHGLSVRQTGSTAASSPLPTFAANGRYVVVVSGTGTALQLLSLRDEFTPATGQAAIRLVNVTASSTFDIYVTDPGAALGTVKASAIGPGAASSYFAAVTTPQQIRLTPAASTAVAIDLGNFTFGAGVRAIVVVA